MMQLHIFMVSIPYFLYSPSRRQPLLPRQDIGLTITHPEHLIIQRPDRTLLFNILTVHSISAPTTTPQTHDAYILSAH
jgi:hypothetical protein